MTSSESSLEDLIPRVGPALSRHGWRLVTAESCTGGLVATLLTDQPGSSDWFEGAFVTYRVSAKSDMVGVPETLVDRYGAVSEPVARAMAEGALENSHADLAVSITGIAGPGGGEPMTPVGTVWFAWAARQPQIECLQTTEYQFHGDRESVRRQAAKVALEGVLEIA